MPFKLPLKRVVKSSSGRENYGGLAWLRRVWGMATGTAILYFAIVYVLPLFRVMRTPIIPFKIAVESLICLAPIISGVILGKHQIANGNASISIEKEILIVSVEEKIIGMCCLEIVSVSSSVFSDDNGRPKYNCSMLLAMRAGMGKSVSMAFETGVIRGEPFLRIFITATGQVLDNIKEILRREATRVEAILLASLNLVELRMLEDNDLREAVCSFTYEFNYEKQGLAKSHVEDISLMVLKGSPQVKPSLESSQIGTFLSTILKQNCSVIMTCVFSASKPGKEKQKLEGKWKTIQSKEKRKEESLKDYAEKKKLITEYEEIQDNVGWFDSSVYFIVRSNPLRDNDIVQEGVRGLILSIWGGENTIKLTTQRISRRTLFKLLSRNHLKKQRMHVSKLVSFINTPIKKLPIIGPEPIPVFQIPPRDSLSDEIEIGDTIFEGRHFSKAGLKIEWFREHVAVLGATGTGKTTLVKHIIAQISDKTSIPWWIFDIKGTEYSGLVGHLEDEILVLKPGLDKSFIISLMDSEIGTDEGCAYSTFLMLRELLKEKGESSELSPAMERLLRESILKLAESLDENYSIQSLVKIVSQVATDDRTGKMTSDALVNRLQILYQEPLGDILSGGPDAIKISSLLNRRVILDLSHVARAGGMESARLLYNLIAKRIFDSSMKRGIVSGLHHVVVLEEASNLVPESYSKQSSADVTTGESMVLLQRATGQGVIVVSTRPNISPNILANTATKIVFRLPYDSQIGGKFLSLTQDQEAYLRSMKRGRALIAIPDTETFEIATKPFIEKQQVITDADSTDLNLEQGRKEPELISSGGSSKNKSPKLPDKVIPKILEDEAQTIVFDKVGRFGNHIIALLASERMATEQQIRDLLSSLDSSAMEDDISEAIRELVTLGSIDRESLSLVPGGFVYTLPGMGLEAIRNVIIDYISAKLGIERDDSIIREFRADFPDMIIEDKAIVIIPEHLRASSMSTILGKIKHHMGILGNGISEMFVVVRGSVAAAKLREILDNDEEYNAINVISAFPTSLESMIESLVQIIRVKDPTDKTDTSQDNDDVDLIEAIHEIGPATSRAIQIRLWFGLIQDFVDLSNGQVRWEILLDFIETTALQSLKGRSAPLTVDEGRRALTELLADEVLIALRVNNENKFIDVEQGLWIINSSILQELKEKATDIIETELKKHHSEVSRNHGYYDLCAGNTSYVIFPNQQQLSTLLNLHSSVACRTCKSIQVMCILTASEYLEDTVVTPGNLIIKTMDDNVSALVI
jgi:energy-coupling factor transporter ATP-binding protein EcfA2